jgi:hypothetical protein
MSSKILVKVEVLIEKLNVLYEDIAKRGGDFTDVDRELLISYSRELYEISQRLKISGDKILRDNSFKFFENDPTKEIKDTPPAQTPALEIPDIPIGAPVKKSLSELYHSESLSINEKFKTPVKVLSDSANETPIKNLKTYISLNKRFIFISRLFNDNSSEFDRAIDVCNSAPDAEAAFKYLNDNFTQKYNWSKEVELVNDLCHFVHRRFI